MTYEEKRELRLQISQLLSDAGLNQAVIKEMVEEEIKNKVDRAVTQCITNLNNQSVENNYVKELIDKYIMNPYHRSFITTAVKEELNRRVIQVVLKDCEVN